VAAIAARCGQVAPQYELLVLAMGQSALRPSEAINLRRRDLDLTSIEEAEFVVGSSYTPAPERFLAAGESRDRPLKGRGAKYRRRVPISPQLARQLRDYLDGRGDVRPDAFVFPTDGGRMDLSNFSRDVWNDARHDVFSAGSPLRKVRRHDLRHSAITAWLNAGVPIKTAQVWSGHRTASTLLDTYLGVMRHDEALGRARIQQAFTSDD
jgi:integrase